MKALLLTSIRAVRWPLVGVVVLGLLLAAVSVKAWFWPSFDNITVGGRLRLPTYHAALTPAATRWERVTEPCVPVVRFVPKPEEIARLARDYNIPASAFVASPAPAPVAHGTADTTAPSTTSEQAATAPAARLDILGEFALKPAPWGAKALVTRSPEGAVDLAVKPNAQPVFELGGRRELGGSYDLVRKSFGLYGEQDLLRAGPVLLGLRGFATTRDPRTSNPGITYGLEVRVGARF